MPTTTLKKLKLSTFLHKTNSVAIYKENFDNRVYPFFTIIAIYIYINLIIFFLKRKNKLKENIPINY
jgi:hypothetical protein